MQSYHELRRAQDKVEKAEQDLLDGAKVVAKRRGVWTWASIQAMGLWGVAGGGGGVSEN